MSLSFVGIGISLSTGMSCSRLFHRQEWGIPPSRVWCRIRVLIQWSASNARPWSTKILLCLYQVIQLRNEGWWSTGERTPRILPWTMPCSCRYWTPASMSKICWMAESKSWRTMHFIALYNWPSSFVCLMKLDPVPYEQWGFVHRSTGVKWQVKTVLAGR